MSIMEVQRLNSLAELNKAQKYLEIGVCTGETFLGVNVTFKVGVDPNFAFDFHKYSDKNTLFYPIKSDKFWSDQCPESLKFDLIYLDGYHTFEQTFRDFCSSLNYAHDQTLWLIDDTIPIGYFASHPNPNFVHRCRKLLNIQETFWMGDVFKVVLAIHDFFPQFNWVTFPGHGQTIVWKEKRKNFCPTWNSFKKISRMNYLDFLHNKNSHFNIINDNLDVFNQIPIVQ